MKKVLPRPVVSLRERQTSIALRIRLAILLGVVAFYSFAVAINTFHTDESTLPGSRNSRKLLSIATNRTSSESPNLVESVKLISDQYHDSNGTTFTNELDEFENCTPPAINEFPFDGFTRSQRLHGWIVIHVLLACYCFWFLAVICDDYFVPAIQQMCMRLNIKEDVAGATFMAAATSSPELFINCVGTFVTKGDIGVGTIVGSAVFNILAVPACCGLFAGQMIMLDWWPITRDCVIYCIAVLGLIGTLYDGIVMWYEALFLVLTYFLYITAMYWNDEMAREARRMISKVRRKFRVRPFRQVNEITPLLGKGSSHTGIAEGIPIGVEGFGGTKCNSAKPSLDESINTFGSADSDYADDPWTRGDTCTLVYVLKWPMTFLLWITTPDSRRHPSWRFVTFAMSVAWIGGISYVIAFLITIIGNTLSIPDSVMGLTILAAGMSIPEAVSSVIVTNQGHGAMGISNSIGSNTFDILLCLGLPWFIKAFFLPTVPDQHWVVLNSSGLTYSAISLLTTLFGLYIAFLANHFHLDWKIGVACTIMYLGFIVLASMIELNFFFDVNSPMCKD